MIDSRTAQPKHADKYWGARGSWAPLGKNRLGTPGFALSNRRGSGAFDGHKWVGAGRPRPAGNQPNVIPDGPYVTSGPSAPILGSSTHYRLSGQDSILLPSSASYLGLFTVYDIGGGVLKPVFPSATSSFILPFCRSYTARLLHFSPIALAAFPFHFFERLPLHLKRWRPTVTLPLGQ